MPITIQGIRITSLTIAREEEGGDKITASYSLMSSVGKVLAKDNFTSKSDYGKESVFVPSSETSKALASAVASYVRDAEIHLGLKEDQF